MRNKRRNTQPVDWTPTLDALLGTVTDARVAKIAGCSGEAVRRRRESLRVRPYRPERSWSARAIEMLGAAPDRETARKLGVSPTAVRIQRHRRGIPPFR